ncbi:hypothetical protein W02_03610 [Nitrospira sp. KM1]|nr:hypothetical protein W02_03610 [Nitrospira sp. KM1]
MRWGLGQGVDLRVKRQGSFRRERAADESHGVEEESGSPMNSYRRFTDRTDLVGIR